MFSFCSLYKVLLGLLYSILKIFIHVYTKVLKIQIFSYDQLTLNLPIIFMGFFEGCLFIHNFNMSGLRNCRNTCGNLGIRTGTKVSSIRVSTNHSVRHLTDQSNVPVPQPPYQGLFSLPWFALHPWLSILPVPGQTSPLGPATSKNLLAVTLGLCISFHSGHSDCSWVCSSVSHCFWSQKDGTSNRALNLWAQDQIRSPSKTAQVNP